MSSLTAFSQELTELKPRQRNLPINLWLGISIEEMRRAKPDVFPWVNRIFPLINLKIDRSNCVALAERVFGYTPPRSSCFFCPYSHPHQWLDMRINDKESFEKAVNVDKSLRDKGMRGVNSVKGAKYECYAHPSLTPLSELPMQGNLFSQECQGFCGV